MAEPPVPALGEPGLQDGGDVTFDDPGHEGGLLGLGGIEMPHPLQQIDHQFLFEVGSVVLGESGLAYELTCFVPNEVGGILVDAVVRIL